MTEKSQSNPLYKSRAVVVGSIMNIKDVEKELKRSRIRIGRDALKNIFNVLGESLTIDELKRGLKRPIRVVINKQIKRG